MKKLLFVILSISIISYPFHSFSSDKDNKKKKEEVCSFTPFKTYQEFLEEHKKTTGKEVQECFEAYQQWYSQWLKNNENFAYKEYLKKPHPARQEFEKHLPEGLRKDIGNIVQGYLYIDFQQWQENNEKLLGAAYKGNIQSIQKLLESGDVDINTQNQYGYTALMIAVRHGHKELVRLLLEKGANVNIQDKYGDTALMIAVLNNNKEIVKLLLQTDANVNIQNNDGNTALMIANNKELVELLLKKGANINTQNRDGSTALMWALFNNNKEIVKLLLEKGADVNVQNHDGYTTLMIAQRLGHKDIAEILNKNAPCLIL